jgi:hypothetical protein
VKRRIADVGDEKDNVGTFQDAPQPETEQAGRGAGVLRNQNGRMNNEWDVQR